MAQFKTKQGISKSFNTCKRSMYIQKTTSWLPAEWGRTKQDTIGELDMTAANMCGGGGWWRTQAGVEHWGRRAHKKHTHSPRAITYSTTEQRGAVRHSCTGDSKPGAVTRQAPAQ